MLRESSKGRKARQESFDAAGEGGRKGGREAGREGRKEGRKGREEDRGKIFLSPILERLQRLKSLLGFTLSLEGRKKKRRRRRRRRR